MANNFKGTPNNNNKNKNNENQDIYRNDGELSDKNSYMIYELNNTFDDKGRNVLNENEEHKICKNNSVSNKNLNNRLENKQNQQNK